METLVYAQENRTNRELIDKILKKARERKGLSHREAAVLLDCELEDKNQEIYALAEQIKKDFAAAKELFEEGHYGAKQDSAWMADSSEDWHWKLQPVFIYGPTKIVIPETEDTSWPM